MAEVHPGAALFSEAARKAVAEKPCRHDIVESLLVAEGLTLRGPSAEYVSYFTNEHETVRMLSQAHRRPDDNTRANAYAIEDLRALHRSGRYADRAKLRRDLLGATKD